MEFNNYDAGSDVEGFFPEEFRKYVRDLNLFCRYDSDFEGWVFRNKHESDDQIASFADMVGTQRCLVQFWRAREVTSIGDFGERRFCLTTRNQPFMFMKGEDDKTPFSEGICSYRMKMVDFITGDGGGGGVIGRVFRNNRVECTPNIGYYSYEEYSNRDLALSCHIKSSLVFPLPDSVGVVEIVSLVEWIPTRFFDILLSLGIQVCCYDTFKQYSPQNAVFKIEEVMRLVVRSCLVCARTWMLCNRCSCLSTEKRLHPYHCEFYKQEYFLEEEIIPLKKGEGVVGKAAISSHNLVYCDDVSQFSITEYTLAHFARYHKLTASFAICLRSDYTGNLVYVLEFFLNPSKVNGKGPRAMLATILEGMRKNFRTFKLASGEEIGDNLSVQVIDAGSPDKFEILEIGKLDSVETMGSNIGEQPVAIASRENQHNNATISSIGSINLDIGDTAKMLNGELPPRNSIGEQPVAIALRENQYNKATISSIGSINLNVGGAAKMLNGELPPWNEIDISLEAVSVSVSTFKRVCRRPPHSGNSAQTGSTKKLGGSASTVQSESLVTIKAKYGDNFIKFKLSASSGINAFHQQVSKRVELEAGSYIVKYQDDDNDWILVRCDDDLQDYISNSVSLGKTTLTMLLEHI